MRRSQNGYADRYRAQRIVIDCLAENATKISSSEVGIAEKDEIEQRIAGMSESVCKKWLQNTFGPSDSETLLPQTPKPLRAVWGRRASRIIRRCTTTRSGRSRLGGHQA